MIKLSSYLLSVILAFGTAEFALAQSGRETVTQATEWFALNSNIKLHKRFGLAFDGQLRYVGALQNAQHYGRLGLEFYITPQLSIIPVGYMYAWNFQYGKQPAKYANNEQRIYQQISYKHNHKKFYISHRFRMEERFIQVHHTGANDEVIYDGYDVYLNRIRYRLQVQYALNKPKIETGAWFLTAYDEIFYGWGKGDTYNKPDQNRIYAAVGYQFNKKMNLQGGPFYQLLIKSNGTKQENNIGALIQFTYNLDFSKPAQ